MSGRYILLIPALFIDGLQTMLSIGLAGVFAGAGATAIVPIGILLGFVINFSFSMTFGAGLIALLAFNSMFYPRYLVSGGGELIPGLNNLPFWTLFVLLSILRKNLEEKGNVQGAAIKFATATSSPTGRAGRVTGGIVVKTTPINVMREREISTELTQTKREEQPQERVSGNLKEIDGIRQGKKSYAPAT